MSELTFYAGQIEVSMNTGIDIQDITDDLQRLTTASGVAEGTLNVTVIGSTGSVTTIEHEPGVVQDLKRAVDQLAPPGQVYAHEQAWHDGNGHSHVQAALLGPSIALAVRNGRVRLGTWQQVVVLNHDNKARKRKVDVSIFGIRAEA